MIKRCNQRIEVQNVVASLSDGVDCLSGKVRNVSRVGMLLEDISQELNSHMSKFSVIVSAKGKEIKMLVEPKWMSRKSSEQKIGFAIIDAPLDWTVFVMNCEPADEDIWAATTHLPGF